MANEPAFGEISEKPEAETTDAESSKDVRFRLAILGDFTGRANRGVLLRGEELADERPLKISYESLDDVFEEQELKLRLPIAGGASFVELEFESLDDFHPDPIFKQVDVFEDLIALKRRVTESYDEASEELASWADEHGSFESERSASRAVTVPRVDSIDELADLEPAATVPEDADELGPKALVARLVGSNVAKIAEDERSEESLEKAVADATAELMREIMHHPDFQTLEATWRGLALVLKAASKGGHIDTLLYDMTAEEFAVDVSSGESLDDTALFARLVKKSAESPDGDPWTAVVAGYHFDVIPSHAEILGRVAKVASRLNAPFLSAMGRHLLVEGFKPEGDADEVWAALRKLPEAKFVGMAVSGFLARPPFGETSRPAESFDFSEFSLGEGTDGCLWANPAFACATMLTNSYLKSGWAFKPGEVLKLENMPLFVYRDADDDEVTVGGEARFTSVVSQTVSSMGFMPLMAVRGRDEMELVRFQSLGEEENELAGSWGKEGAAPPPQRGVGGAGDVGLKMTSKRREKPKPAKKESDGDDDDDDFGMGGDDDDDFGLGGGDDDDFSLGGDDDDDFGLGGDDDDLGLGGDDDDLGLGGDSDDDDVGLGDDDSGGDDDLGDLLAGMDDDDSGDDDDDASTDDDDDLGDLLAGIDDDAADETGEDDASTDDDDDLGDLLAGIDDDGGDEAEDTSTDDDDDELGDLLAGIDDDDDQADDESGEDDASTDDDDDLGDLLAGIDDDGDDDAEDASTDDDDDLGDLLGESDDTDDVGMDDDIADTSGDEDALMDEDFDSDIAAEDADAETADDEFGEGDDDLDADTAALMDDEGVDDVAEVDDFDVAADEDDSPVDLEAVALLDESAREDGLIDFAHLLEPISDDEPAGDSIPFDVREQLTEMRKEVNPEAFSDDDPMRPEDSVRADWDGIEHICGEMLREKSKDLTLAAV